MLTFTTNIAYNRNPRVNPQRKHISEKSLEDVCRGSVCLYIYIYWYAESVNKQILRSHHLCCVLFLKPLEMRCMCIYKIRPLNIEISTLRFHQISPLSKTNKIKRTTLLPEFLPKPDININLTWTQHLILRRRWIFLFKTQHKPRNFGVDFRIPTRLKSIGSQPALIPLQGQVHMLKPSDAWRLDDWRDVYDQKHLGWESLCKIWIWWLHMTDVCVQKTWCSKPKVQWFDNFLLTCKPPNSCLVHFPPHFLVVEMKSQPTFVTKVRERWTWANTVHLTLPVVERWRTYVFNRRDS